MKKIIVISGKQFSGKDTLAKILLENLESFKRIGLADAIKIEYGKRKGLSVEEIEKNKSTFRSDLIALGNEGRAIDQDYWIKAILETPENVIVPDIRVPHEVDAFKLNGAFCIRVEASEEARSQRGKLSQSNDYTETALDSYNNWDYVIENNQDYETLKEKSKILLAKIKKFFEIIG